MSISTTGTCPPSQTVCSRVLPRRIRVEILAPVISNTQNSYLTSIRVEILAPVISNTQNSYLTSIRVEILAPVISNTQNSYLTSIRVEILAPVISNTQYNYLTSLSLLKSGEGRRKHIGRSFWLVSNVFKTTVK